MIDQPRIKIKIKIIALHKSLMKFIVAKLNA